MAMTKKEALLVLKFVGNTFNIEFEKEKGVTWLKLLMESGNYEETMNKAKHRAINGKPFKPSLSEIIAKDVKRLEVTRKDLEEQEHARRFEEDEEYRNKILKERQAIKEEYQDFINELKEGSSDEL